MSTASTPAAGWFPDPGDARQLRWWDGSAWTTHVHPMPASTHGNAVEEQAPIDDRHRLEIVRDDSTWRCFPDGTSPAAESNSAAADGQHAFALPRVDPRKLVIVAMLLPTLLNLPLALMVASGSNVALILMAVVGFAANLIVPVGLIGAVLFGIWWVHSGPGRRIPRVLDEWCAQRGLRRIGGRIQIGDRMPPLSRDDFDLALSPLQAAGAFVGAGGPWTPQFAGRLWEHGGDGRLTSIDLGTTNTPSELFIVATIALPDQFARFTGVSATFGAPGARRTNALASRLRGWEPISFEAASSTLGVEVHAHPDQDLVAVWELFDPAYLADAPRRLVSASGADVVGFVIAGQRLAVWSNGSVRSATLERLRLDQGRDPGVHRGSMARVDALVGVARDVHRRLCEVWD